MAHPLSHTARPLLTEREVGDLCTVTPRTVRRWGKRGVITPVRIGGITRYRATEVWALIDPETAERPDVTPAARETSTDASAGRERVAAV